MGLILEFAGFYTYPWQNRLAEAQAFVAYAGYRISSEIAVGDNDISFEIELPPGVDENKARQKFLEVLNQSGFTLFLRTPASPVVLPPAPSVPPWWEALTVTNPRTKIYANVDKAQVYFSSDPEHAPSFVQKEVTSTGQLRTVALGASVEVWRAPIPRSGWICVAIPVGRALWMRAEDMILLSKISAAP